MAFTRRLTSPEQAKSVWNNIFPKIQSYLSSGNELRLIIEKESKSRDQESMYHALIDEIAKQATHLGAKWDAESWKRLLVDKFCKDTGINPAKVIPNLTGDGIVQLGMQTRKFTKEQGSEFIEFLHAWAAEAGIDL